MDRDVFVRVLDVGVLSDGHSAVANITLAGEFDSFLGSLNDDYEKEIDMSSVI